MVLDPCAQLGDTQPTESGLNDMAPLELQVSEKPEVAPFEAPEPSEKPEASPAEKPQASEKPEAAPLEKPEPSEKPEASPVEKPQAAHLKKPEPSLTENQPDLLGLKA